MLQIILGAILSTIPVIITTKMTNNQKLKEMEQSYKIEREKLRREDDLKKLNFLLKPAISIYIHNETHIEIGEDHYGIGFVSDGLVRKSALSLIKLFDENQEYADLEIFEEYLKIKSMYEIDYQKFGYTDKNNPNNESCNIFDENLELYKKIKLKAKNIEENYS